MNELLVTLEHPPSGAKMTLNGQTLTQLVQTLTPVAKELLSLAIQTAPIWLPLVMGQAPPPKAN